MYDAARRRTLISGGVEATELYHRDHFAGGLEAAELLNRDREDMWQWDGSHWTKVVFPTPPPDLALEVYDPTRSQTMSGAEWVFVVQPEPAGRDLRLRLRRRPRRPDRLRRSRLLGLLHPDVRAGGHVRPRGAFVW